MQRKEAGNMARSNELEQIIKTTEIGETIVLVEKEENTYIRTKVGLRRLSSKTISVEKINKYHHQCQ